MEILQGLLDNLTALLAAHPLAGEWYMAFVRFLFPALAVLILYRAVRSLLRIPHTPENWGQLSLPNGTSLELQGAKVDLAADPQWLAEALTDFVFDRPLYTFAREGFAPFRDEYKAACVNLGRHVTFDLPGGCTGSGTAIDVDADGQLIVRTDSGEEHVFTGEVSVRGIYGSL